MRWTRRKIMPEVPQRTISRLEVSLRWTEVCFMLKSRAPVIMIERNEYLAEWGKINTTRGDLTVPIKFVHCIPAAPKNMQKKAVNGGNAEKTEEKSTEIKI